MSSSAPIAATEEPDNAPPKHKGGKWQKGQSGNPAGMKTGSRHKATLAAQALLDGEAEALTRKAVEKALEGDATALRLCLERIIPPRKDRPVTVALPAVETAKDLVAAASALAQAATSGEITPSEAADLSKLIANVASAIEVAQLEERLRALEAQIAAKGSTS